METDENKTQSRSRSASINTEAFSNETQEETQVASRIRKIKPKKSTEEHPTLMKFAGMAPVAEGATGEKIIITRNGDEVAEVAVFTLSWFYGGYQSLVALIKQINKLVQQNMNTFLIVKLKIGNINHPRGACHG
ncbi:hypothetical protein DSO57_1039692 [Entomophthora muscae]|uniref:Uncharacterized protein n=1 Tax=Entomophthora muscae TaxID=34485 RepID=A0ACC2UKV5_9FUNG|nr:hypothetical protein DSO57_1039692 [Entomophthora muscae]